MMAKAASKVILNNDQRQRAIAELATRELPFRIELKKAEPPSTLSMKRTWRMWMEDTAKWMAANGATMPLYHKPDGTPVGKRPFNKDDAYECFLRLWGGEDEDGDREHQESTDKAVLLYIMDKHLAWASERGIPLRIPKDGEYMRLTKRAEGAE